MIYTVTGKKEKADYGKILMHEHIGCISNDMIQAFGKEWLDKKKLADFAVDILKMMKTKYGVGMIVDGTPIDLGRDIMLIKEVSERADLPIVASTGLYHYPSQITTTNDAEEIASWFIGEFENGIEGTDIKPGILKVASDALGITEDNKKRLTAMAIAQRDTNLPIYVHSNHAPGLAEKQLEILTEHISNPGKIIIGHSALNADAGYLEKILDRGCYISVDQCHCVRSNVGKTLAELCEKGYANKIVLANDMCIYSDFEHRENRGFQMSAEKQAERFGYVLTVIHEGFLENGGSEKDWNMMLTENPVKILDM